MGKREEMKVRLDAWMVKYIRLAYWIFHTDMA